MLGVAGRAVIEADDGNGVEVGKLMGAVKAEPPPRDLALEGAEGVEGDDIPETFVNIAADDSGLGRGPKFVGVFDVTSVADGVRNIDLVPSTNRPPNGGPEGAGEGAGLDADDETRLEGKAGVVGVEGPAPGD